MLSRLETQQTIRSWCGEMFRRPAIVRDLVDARVGRFMIRPHRHHDELQLDLLVGCAGSVTVDGEPVEVDGVSLLTHYPGRMHGYDLTGGRRWHLKLAAGQLSVGVRSRLWARFENGLTPDATVVHAIDDLAKIPIQQGERPPRLLAKVAEVLSLWPVRDLSAVDASTVDDARDLAKAIRLIGDSDGKPPSLDELAAAAHLSRRHFARRFRGHFGCSPGDFANAHRLSRAKALLAGGGSTASATGAAVGFAHASAFTRWFTQHVGQTPDAFRRDPHVA
jgi:AraC-like DNA-binding protein